MGDPELSSPTSNSTCLIIDLSVLEIACKVWQAQALQEFNIQGSIFHFMSTSSFATCRKSRYISRKYCKHTGACTYVNTKYIYTDIHLLVFPKKYAWHKHLQAS